jgi:molybdopterin converting factor small subunit
MNVVFFAGLKEFFSSSMEVPSDITYVHELKSYLRTIVPESSALLDSSRFAQGSDLLSLDSKIENDVPIAVLPPSSGG